MTMTDAEYGIIWKRLRSELSDDEGVLYEELSQDRAEIDRALDDLKAMDGMLAELRLGATDEELEEDLVTRCLEAFDAECEAETAPAERELPKIITYRPAARPRLPAFWWSTAAAAALLMLFAGAYLHMRPTLGWDVEYGMVAVRGDAVRSGAESVEVLGDVATLLQARIQQEYDALRGSPRFFPQRKWDVSAHMQPLYGQAFGIVLEAQRVDRAGEVVSRSLTFEDPTAFEAKVQEIAADFASELMSLE